MTLTLSQLIQHFNESETLDKISAEESDLIRSGYIGIPDDYIRFLEQAGYGDLGSVILYSGPVNAFDIYPKSLTHLATTLLFGDDSQGYCFGFNPESLWQIVEVSPRGELRCPW